MSLLLTKLCLFPSQCYGDECCWTHTGPGLKQSDGDPRAHMCDGSLEILHLGRVCVCVCVCERERENEREREREREREGVRECVCVCV